MSPPTNADVDETLIADRLALTPDERLRENAEMVRVVVALRRAAGVFDERFDDPVE